MLRDAESGNPAIVRQMCREASRAGEGFVEHDAAQALGRADAEEEGEEIMANLRRWILDAAEGEPIEAVVLGQMGWGDYGSESVPGYAEQRRGVPLTWAEAEPMIDYDFGAGFGAPRCNAIVAWTQDLVISVSQYDGATEIFAIPRNPKVFMPTMPGG